MKRIFFLKWALCLMVAVGYGSMVMAQEDANWLRSKRIYDLMLAGEGDSIHALLSNELQQKLAPAVFADMFGQVEKQFGKLQTADEWAKDVAQGITIYYRDMQFERYRLRFLLSFDADGSMNTIRMLPAPAGSTAQAVVYDKNKMEERDIKVGIEGFKLPGTLTLPRTAVSGSKPKVPCVVLVHGSGPNDRDETVGPNKPFRDLAWGLAERGIAVIRYDKRTRVYAMNPVPAGRVRDYDVECVDDAVAIASWAKMQPELHPDSIYVLGHSLGATLAPRIAQRSQELAGIILLAGTARPLEDVLVEQITYIASITDASLQANEKIEEIKRQAANVKKLGSEAFSDSIPLPLGASRSYWEFANAYKPVEVAAQLKLPVLVLQGERDYQVTMEDFGLWRFGLLRCRNVLFKSYPKLNHLLQEGSGKSTPFEYNQASPVPAYLMDDVAGFVHRKGVKE